MHERSILPFALHELTELVSRTGDEEDQLTLMLAAPAHCIKTGIAEGGEETSVLVFSVLCILPGLLFGKMGRRRGRGCPEDENEVDVTHEREACLKRD